MLLTDLELKKWTIKYKPGWDVNFQNFDKSIRDKILNKIEHMKQTLQSRGLKNHPEYKIEEVGSYRIIFIQDDENHTKSIHLIADHKYYDAWWGSLKP